MKLTKKQYKVIEPYLPKVRGNVRISHIQFLNTLLYLAESGCKWRRLPKNFGPWHTVYMRTRRWSKNGSLQKIIEVIQKESLMDVDLSVLLLDSTDVKEYPDGRGVMKKTKAGASQKRKVKKTPKSI
ncbi:MAG: transposase [Planctomycetia bacterium]|nr:transposase [Planctomycetia bacterium]